MGQRFVKIIHRFHQRPTILIPSAVTLDEICRLPSAGIGRGFTVVH